jgi:hypothetical protein
MLAEWEAPDFTTPAVGVIAGVTASVMFSALDAARAAGGDAYAEYLLQQAHIERSNFERELALHQQTLAEKEALEDHIVELYAGFARVKIAMRK